MTGALSPAPRYDTTHDLWVIAAYYNPHGYKTRAAHFARFSDSLRRSDIALLTVECAFFDEPFALPPGPWTLQFRCTSVLWQKERLLNVAIAKLPPQCTKVAWLDADILFTRPSWAVDTSRLLDTCTVVQVFDKVVRLPKGATHVPAPPHRGKPPEVIESFASVYERNPTAHLDGHYHLHGHTGFGWAARKDLLLRVGLYDTSLSGSGDHLIAHAAVGDHQSKCIDKVLGTQTPERDHFRRYCDRFFAHSRGLIKSTPGTVLHLWHGEHEHRRYSDRNRELIDLGFDPKTDLRLGEVGAWEWASPHQKLHAWAHEYFARRKEDGE